MVPRKRTHQEPRSGLIAGNAVNAADIGFHNGVQIIEGLDQGVLTRKKVACDSAKIHPAVWHNHEQTPKETVR